MADTTRNLMTCRPFNLKEMKIRHIFAKILMLLYIVTVCYLCFAKFPQNNDIPRTLFGFPSDKVVHFLMFFPFPILAYFAFHNARGKWYSMVGFLLIVAALGMLMSWCTEEVQGMLVYRCKDLDDFRADAAGIGLGALLILMYSAVSRKW